jgi:anti-sigma factor RsiW
MVCADVEALVESVASGDTGESAAFAEHVRACPSCARALDHARRIDRLLREQVVVEPSVQFTSRVVSKVRRERWRGEELFDASFNVALVLVLSGLVGVAWIVLSRMGLTPALDQGLALVGDAIVTFGRRVAPELPLYAAATGLLSLALAVWWWAERDSYL